MSRYTIELSPETLRTLRRIKDVRLHDRLTSAIADLKTEPRPPGVKKMAGKADDWRIRVGDWRVIYRIEDGRLVVLVVSVGPRGGEATDGQKGDQGDKASMGHRVVLPMGPGANADGWGMVPGGW